MELSRRAVALTEVSAVTAPAAPMSQSFTPKAVGAVIVLVGSALASPCALVAVMTQESVPVCSALGVNVAAVAPSIAAPSSSH